MHSLFPMGAAQGRIEVSVSAYHRRTIDVPTFGILRFAGSQAVERWGMADNLAIMQQLGMMGYPRSAVKT
jgi:hypothetical protein